MRHRRQLWRSIGRDQRMGRPLEELDLVVDFPIFEAVRLSGRQQHAGQSYLWLFPLELPQSFAPSNRNIGDQVGQPTWQPQREAQQSGRAKQCHISREFHCDIRSTKCGPRDRQLWGRTQPSLYSAPICHIQASSHKLSQGCVS